MHTSLLFTTSLVLALAPSAAAQDASCQASAHESAACQKASAVSVKATTVAAPVVASDDDAPACCAEKAQTVKAQTGKAQTVALDTVAQDTMSDDEIANLLKEVRAALAEVESAAQEATKLEAAALPTTLAAVGYAATPDERGYMGISMQIGDGAMTVEEVMEGSGAAKAGLRVGDRILTIAGQSTEDTEALMAHLSELQAGDTVKITYERDGKQRKAKIELSTLAAIESGGTGGTGEQRELEKVEASEGVIEWFEVGDGDDAVEEIVGVVSRREHEPQVFTQKGGDRKLHVIGRDGLHLEGLEGLMDLEKFGVKLEGLEGLLGGHGIKLELEGLEGFEALKGLHLNLGEMGDLKGLEGHIRININGRDIDLSELENLGGLFKLQVEAGDEDSGHRRIELHEAHGEDNDILQRVILRMGGQDGRHIVQFGNRSPVVVEFDEDSDVETDVKFGYAIAVTGEDGEPQIIEIEGLTDGDFIKNFKLPKGIQVKGGNVIHLRHDDGDDDDDSPSRVFFFSADDDDDGNVRFEHRGQVIIKTQTDGGEPQIQEFTFGGEDGELPEKIRELLKSHGGVGQGFFAHGDGDHEFKVDIQAFTEGKGGNVHILRSHAGGDANVLFFSDEDHELPKGVREMMKNRVQFDPQGGRWSFTVDVDVDDDDDDDHHGMRVFEFDGGNWTGDFLGRFDNQELGRRIRERVERGMQRVQLREVREGRGRDDVRGLEHEIEALRDRIQELERAIERLGRRR